MSDRSKTEVLQDIHQQTAKIAWRDLQRFFAQGRVLQLDASLDLIEVAYAVISDSSGAIAPLIDKQLLIHPSDAQAAHWYQQDEHLWAVVVAPYVLVQDGDFDSQNSES